MESITRIARAVRKKTLYRKASELGRVTRAGKAEEDGAVRIQPSSEQLAEEYRSELDEHPSLRDVSFEARGSTPVRCRDAETGTTWSGLMAGAMGITEPEV
jgi:hypothetical protein